jgi:hypothetical protein
LAEKLGYFSHLKNQQWNRIDKKIFDEATKIMKETNWLIGCKMEKSVQSKNMFVFTFGTKSEENAIAVAICSKQR